MKNLASILPLAATLALAACDNVDEDERWNIQYPVEIKKNVLIEDFTGQKCVNCPNAATLIHEMQKNGSIGQHVIAVSIHGGSMSYSIDKLPIGLATEAGEEYNRHWNVASWPNGLVDRKGGLQEYTNWNTSVAQRLACQPTVGIGVDAEYGYDDSRNTAGTLDIAVSLTEATPGALANARLNVWLTESGITTMQMMPDGSNNLNYVHNHVLRDCLTTTFGDAVTTDGEGKATWQTTYSIPLKYGRSNIYTHPAFMDVVAFVTDGPDGEVLQVVQVPAAPMLN